MRRTIAAGTVAGLLLAALVAGCGPGSPSAGGPVPLTRETGPITFAVGKDDVSFFQKLVSWWNQSHPAKDPRVTLVQLPETANEQLAQLAANLQAKSPLYDVIDMDVVWTAEFASAGWVIPLDGSKLPLRSFLPPAVRTAMYGGRLYAVPFYSNAELLYYRSDLLSRAHAAKPTTWAELARQASTIAPRYGLGGYAGQFAQYEGLTVNFATAVQSAGGSILSADGTKVTVDSPQALKALKFLVSGVADGWIPRTALTYAEETSREAFESGHLLFLSNWPYVYSDLSTPGPGNKVYGKFKVAALPGPSGPGSGSLGGADLAISSFSRHQGGALDFIRWATSLGVQRRMFIDSSFPPVWQSLYSDPGLERRFPYLHVLEQAILAAQPRPAITDYDQASLIISSAVYQALSLKETPQLALQEMAEQLTQIIHLQTRWELTFMISSRPWRAAGVGLAAVALTVGVAACGGSSTTAGTGNTSTSSASGSATSGNITWWASPITTSGADPRTVLIGQFEKAYPKIHVTLQSAPTDTDTNRSSLITTISGGASSPDVYMGDVIWPGQFGKAGLAEPLSKYLPSSYFSTFASGLVQGATYNGQVYGAPFFEDEGFMYYRKDLLAKEHLSVPTTWEQLESDAVKIKNAGLTKYGYVWEGASYEGLTCNFMEYLGSAGGTVLNSGMTSATINSPAGVKALTFMRSLITSGASPAAVTTMQEPQAMSAFAAGQSAFLRNWDYGYNYANTASSPSKIAGKVGVAPLPGFAGETTPGTSNIGGWNLYINPHSKNIAADVTFIKWMTGSQAETVLATQFSEIPTVQSVRTSAQVVAANPVLATVPHTRLIPRPAGTPDYAKVSQAIYTNVNAVLTGSSSASAGLSSAASQINSAVSSSGL